MNLIKIGRVSTVVNNRSSKAKITSRFIYMTSSIVASYCSYFLYFTAVEVVMKLCTCRDEHQNAWPVRIML